MNTKENAMHNGNIKKGMEVDRSHLVAEKNVLT